MDRLMGLILSEAQKCAHQSQSYHHHGAVLLHRNNIVAKGYNRRDRPKLQQHCLTCSTHAEMDCMRHLIKQKPTKFKKYIILVVRVTRAGTLCNSRPCTVCINLMNKIGIHKVYYSVEGGGIAMERCKHMKHTHLSSGTIFKDR